VEIVDSSAAESFVYLSPEQVRGRPGDSRTDIYAVGLILYEMVTGIFPFEGSDTLALLEDRLDNYPLPPREIDSKISPELQEIIYRALERNPRKRYASAWKLATDLAHQEQVTVRDRIELTNWRKRRSSYVRTILEALQALAPVAAMLILLYRSD
jgi:serine/threonine protein kinase